MLSNASGTRIGDVSKRRASDFDDSCEAAARIGHVDMKVDKLLQLVSGVFSSTVPSTCKPAVLPGPSSPICTLECGATELVSGMKDIQKRMNIIEASLPSSPVCALECGPSELVSGVKDMQRRMSTIEASLAKISDTVEATRTALNMEAVQIAMHMSESESWRFREACISAGIPVRSPGDAMQSRHQPSDAVQSTASVAIAGEADLGDSPCDVIQQVASVPVAKEADLHDSPGDIQLDTDINSIDDELRMQRAQHARACRLTMDPAFRVGKTVVSGQPPRPGCNEHSVCGKSFGSSLETSSPQASVAHAAEADTLAHSDPQTSDTSMFVPNDSHIHQCSSPDAVSQRFPELPSQVGIAADADTLRSAHPADIVAFVSRVHQESVCLHKAYDDAFRRHLEFNHTRNELTNPTCDYSDLKAAAASRFEAVSRATSVAAEALSAWQKRENTMGCSPDAVSEAHALVQRLKKLQHKRVQIVFAHQTEQCQSKYQLPDNGKSAKKQLGARACQKLASADEQIEETMSELRHCEAELRE